MNNKKIDIKKAREFRLTTFSLRNKSTIFLLTIVLGLFGLFAYFSMPREMFPEIKIPNILVQTIYPGNPPIDMENLITRPIEKELNTITGIKEIKSVSTQDISSIFVEFNTNIEINNALRDVKDAVDRSKKDLPSDLDLDPFIIDFDVNEFPVININLSGDYSIEELRDFAEYLQDEIEKFPEISRVEIKGLNNREIHINIDKHKMDLLKLSFQDIEDAIAFENISLSGGDLKIDDTRRSVRIIGEFKTINEIKNIIVKHEKGNIIYLKDVAEVKDDFEDPLTLARLNLQPVVSLQVIKKAGENLLSATSKIFTLLNLSQEKGSLPENLRITISNDQSDMVKKMINNLENSIILGIIFVVLVLYSFLGTRNALFVGIAIPMSMTISFVILSLIGSTLNMMVLFGLVLALGMLVDNAIVAVENTFRFTQQGYSLFESAKRGVGEIAIAIIASTLTTLAAFIPLIFWGGIMGEFMKYLPITLVIVLSSSLFVALVIIPVFFTKYFKPEKENQIIEKRKILKKFLIILGIAFLFFLIKINVLGSIFVIYSVIYILNQFFFRRLSNWFRNEFLIKLENGYLKLIEFSLKGKMPVKIFIGTFILMILTMIFFNLRRPGVQLFPVNQPSFVNVFAELPIGSDIEATNKVMKKIEKRVFETVKPDMKIIKSILTTIGKGVVGQNETTVGNTPNKGMITISFVDYKYRNGKNTSKIMKKIGDSVHNKYPGVILSVEKNKMGPPTGKAVNLEIIGDDYGKLVNLTRKIQKYIEDQEIDGIEALKIDLDIGKPELIVNINREKARRFGLSTGQIGSTIRTSLFGKEVSEFKEGEDEYPIILRFDKKYRDSIASILDQKITFRSRSTGKIMQVPISAVAGFSLSNTYGSVRRKDLKRVITLFSNVVEGYNATKINNRLKKIMLNYDIPEGFNYRFTGEQEEQAKTASFLMRAMMIAISLIMIILVTQFNSFAKPFIIMASVFFSTIGVFGGIATFRMDFIILMTGIGIISLAGIVVNNAIVLIDYIDYLKMNRKNELGIKPEGNLDLEEIKECIIRGGKTRLRPVLLTAITTILGLIPMATGLNINFSTLLSEFNPQLYFGGDSAIFWGPMAWTVIFGLTFATFLTLVLVPSLYLIGNRIKLNFINKRKKV